MQRSSLRPFYVIAAATVLLALARISLGQTAGETELNEAYRALASKDYDQAVALFRKGLSAGAGKAAAHKDLAYTLLKAGENEEARDEFEAALRMDSTDETAALEYAFLAYETKKPIEARRTFDKLRNSKNPQTRATAEKAFQNIDRPLAEGIRRWKEALARAAKPNELPMYSAHWELGQLAELRDDTRLAAEQYGICRQLKPQLSELLLILARVWKKANRIEEANAALLAASRSKNSRTAEIASEQWGTRYPYPYEFLAALKLDEQNTDLRRELAYLYLAMHKNEEAKEQFKRVLEIDPNDQLAGAQLSALYGFSKRPVSDPALDPVVMGKKSLALGYSHDAVKYLRQAHEEHPNDAEIMLDLGYAYNLAKDDADAIPWFDRARHAEDPLIAAEASKAFRNLRGDTLPQTTFWMQPMYSSRWQDMFTDGQIKRTLPLSAWNHLLSLYLSTRFSGDLDKSNIPARGALPQQLATNSFIVGTGIETKTWHHLMGWAEAGEFVRYLPARHVTSKAVPDYRGGVSFAKGFGTLLDTRQSGWFYETDAAANYISQFDKDWFFGSRHRAGRTFYFKSGVIAQALFNVNYQHDLKHEYWANTVETGPGLKLRLPYMPPNVYFYTDLLRGVYTNNMGNPYRPNYNDIRVGFWYAFTR
jgi:tetratricopeptide (TPR) repeat protein